MKKPSAFQQFKKAVLKDWRAHKGCKPLVLACGKDENATWGTFRYLTLAYPTKAKYFMNKESDTTIVDYYLEGERDFRTSTTELDLYDMDVLMRALEKAGAAITRTHHAAVNDVSEALGALWEKRMPTA